MLQSFRYYCVVVVVVVIVVVLVETVDDVVVDGSITGEPFTLVTVIFGVPGI